MAGMFYTFEEAAEKLNKTEQELKGLVKQGKLREFRDGTASYFKIDEVEAFASEEGITVAPEAPEAEEPAYVPSEPESYQPEEQEVAPAEYEEEEMELPELEGIEAEVPAEEPEMADTEALMEEIPAAEVAKAEKTATAKPKKAAKKSRSKARPRIKRTSKPQRLSFRQWLLFGLTEDNPVAIFVLVLLFCIILVAFAALGYGLYLLNLNL